MTTEKPEGMERPITISCAQLGPADEHKEGNLKRILDLIRMAGDRGSQLTVFPELALTPYFCGKNLRDAFERYFDPIPNRYLDQVQAAARQAQTAVILGLGEVEGPAYYNTAVVVAADGSLVGKYRKVHIPAGFPRSAEGATTYEKMYFRPGNLGFPVFDIGPAKLGVQICYDRQFPEGFRCLALAGSEIIAVPTNMATYESKWRGQTWELVLRTRAFENGLFIVGVNKAGKEWGREYVGSSLIASPLGGEVMAKATTDGDEVVTATVDLTDNLEATKRLPFARDRRPDQYGPLVEA